MPALELASECTRTHLRTPKILKSSWGACPQTPIEVVGPESPPSARVTLNSRHATGLQVQSSAMNTNYMVRPSLHNAQHAGTGLPQMTPSLHGLSVLGFPRQAESGIGAPVPGTMHFAVRVCLPPWQVSEHWRGVVERQEWMRAAEVSTTDGHANTKATTTGSRG